jgi:hypothetical protein
VTFAPNQTISILVREQNIDLNAKLTINDGRELPLYDGDIPRYGEHIVVFHSLNASAAKLHISAPASQQKRF